MRTAAVITVSDKCAIGLRKDESGAVIATLLTEAGYKIVSQRIVPDEERDIIETLLEASNAGASLILTTGGTGFSPRDRTPEATIAVCERMVPGIPEAMRAESLKITPRAMLSRAVCGIRGGSLILNLPGSPKAAEENLLAVLDTLGHGLDILSEEARECATPTARVLSVHTSPRKGEAKTPILIGTLCRDHGLEGDAHAGTSAHRQVSLLGIESVNALRHVLPDLLPGAFAENILTEGIELHTLPLGTRLQIGTAICEVTQIGKECHDTGCAIRQAVGDCVMPREGIFVRVLTDGTVKTGDKIRPL